MMLDRDKLSFWTRIGAIGLAVVFVGSFVFMGVGTDISYDVFDLFGGASEQQKDQKTGAEEQITRAQEDLAEDPDNPKIIRRLAGLYLQEGRTEDAIQVLEEGHESVQDDPIVLLYLGQAYDRKAQGLTDEGERQATYEQAGDAYAAAAEIQEDEPQPYLLAGQAYELAGEKGKAIQYWNDYLELEPEGERADAVKERISALLKGEETPADAQGAKKQ